MFSSTRSRYCKWWAAPGTSLRTLLTKVLPPPRTSTPGTTSPSSSNGININIPTPAIIGGIIGGLFFLGLIVQAVRFVLRKQRQKVKLPVAVHSQVPAYAPVSTQSQVPGYTPVTTQGQFPPYTPVTTQSQFPPYTPVTTQSQIPTYTPVTAQSQIPNYTPVTTQSHVPSYTPLSTQLTLSPPPPATYNNPPAPTHHPFDYYSAPVATPATPIQQPHDNPTTEEVNRLRQEMDAMRTAMYEQQQHQQGGLIHEEDGGDMPPPEYQPTAESQPSGTWQPPRAPPPEKSKN